MKNEKYRVPHPTKPGKTISRQRAWQIQKQKEGLCVICAKPMSPDSNQLCPEHHRYSLDHNRLKGRVSAILGGGTVRPHCWLENKPDLSGADWSLSNRVLAEQYHTTPCIVNGYRIRNEKGRRSQGSQYDFSKVDWRKRDDEIAKELGSCRSAIWFARKRLGIPSYRVFKKAKQIMDQIESLT